jgi:hypothetical protein
MTVAAETLRHALGLGAESCARGLEHRPQRGDADAAAFRSKPQPNEPLPPVARSAETLRSATCWRNLRPIRAHTLAIFHLTARLREHGERRENEQRARPAYKGMKSLVFQHIPARLIPGIPARFVVAGPNRSASPAYGVIEAQKHTTRLDGGLHIGRSRNFSWSAITRIPQNRRFCKSISCDGRTRADFRPIRAVAPQPERRESPCYSPIFHL